MHTANLSNPWLHVNGPDVKNAELYLQVRYIEQKATKPLRTTDH